MRSIMLATAVAVLSLSLSALTGCRADPHDTHISTPVVAPR